MRNICNAIVVTLLLSACAGREPLQSTTRLTVVQNETGLPAPDRKDLIAADRPSLIGPLDTLQIDVFNVPELSREMQVDASGRISMPLVGTIEARGKTAGELADAIEGTLRGRYVRKPEVTVNIKSSVSQVVTIDGQVIEPGLYPVTNQMTLLRAIASAKGLSEFAREEDVVILRTVDGRKMAGLYNINAIRRGAYDDPAIYANDVVVVGDSPAASQVPRSCFPGASSRGTAHRCLELGPIADMNMISSHPRDSAALGGSGFQDVARDNIDAMSVIRQYIRIAQRWRYIILGVTAACVILGLIVTLLMTPKFTATTSIEILREANQVTNFQGVERETGIADQEFYQTQYSLLASKSLALNGLRRSYVWSTIQNSLSNSVMATTRKRSCWLMGVTQPQGALSVCAWPERS